jgi:NAD(P)-dependent dehydrogenase (short-subunit alcohol dehydrogenase family)
MGTTKLAVITGAMGALGMPIATELARRGYRVVLVGRDAERLSAACARVEEASKGAAESLVCDLSSQASIRTAAAELLKRHPVIDLLVNNVATFTGTRRASPDGHELMLATNHLAPFLFTLLLKDALFAAKDARVVCMTMGSNKPPVLEDLESERKFKALDTLFVTKGMNHFFVRELAERWKGKVSVFAVNPDMTRTTLVKEAPLPLRIVFALFGQTPEKAKAGAIHAATSAELTGRTGLYFGKKKHETFMTESGNEALRAQLWDLSAKLVGLGTPDQGAVA